MTSALRYSPPQPFRISIDDAAIARVQQFASLTDVTLYLDNVLDHQPEDYRQYGIPPKTYVALLERLKSGYDWRRYEAEMNAMGEHVKVTVHDVPDEGDMVVHAVVRRSGKPGAIPLLLVHGWPGDFYEFRHLAKVLTEGSPAFDVVMPSIPGFIFSQAPKKGDGQGQGWSVTKSALVMDAVMRSVLGEGVKYVGQGGDLGSPIVRRTAQLFPESCRAIHLNFGRAPAPVPEKLSEIEKRGLDQQDWFVEHGAAYANMQRTVPYTTGAVLSSSPIALLAYMGEKHIRWAAPSTKPTLDDVITHTLLYWFTGSITSSFWLYRGRGEGEDADLVNRTHVTVPTALGFGQHEIFWLAEQQYAQFFNLKSYTILDDGGHFLAQERPELLAADMRKHFAKYGVA